MTKNINSTKLHFKNQAAAANKNINMLTSIATKKRIKRCVFKGCRKTENDCKIVNHSCEEHHAAVKLRDNNNRKSLVIKNNAIKRKNFDFNVTNYVNSKNFLKIYSFLDDVIKTAALGKGTILALNHVAGSHYHALKRYGVTIVEKSVTIDDDEHEKFMTYVDKVKNTLEPSFTGLTATNEPKFIAKGRPNRFVKAISFDDQDFHGWNKIEQQLEMMMENLKLPNTKGKKVDPKFDMHFNLLMIDPGVDHRQHEHTDVLEEFELGSNTKHFHMIGLTAIDKQSFLYVQPLGMQPMLVLIEKGDTLLMRHDIPHAGAENFTEHKNVRLHSFIDVLSWNLQLDNGYSVKKVDWLDGPKIVWDPNNLKFVVV